MAQTGEAPSTVSAFAARRSFLASRSHLYSRSSPFFSKSDAKWEEAKEDEMVEGVCRSGGRPRCPGAGDSRSLVRKVVAVAILSGACMLQC